MLQKEQKDNSNVAWEMFFGNLQMFGLTKYRAEIEAHMPPRRDGDLWYQTWRFFSSSWNVNNNFDTSRVMIGEMLDFMAYKERKQTGNHDVPALWAEWINEWMDDTLEQ